ncbi:hypothetical protein [Raineya sp.]|jgi:hypothetical protein
MLFRKNAVIAAAVSFFITCIIPLYIWGFQMPSVTLLKSLGLAWFILLLPQFLPQPRKLLWWRTYSLQSVYLLLSLASLGFLKRYAEWLGFLSWGIALLGILAGLYIFGAIASSRAFSVKKIVGYAFLALLVGSYLLGHIYKFAFSPILLENFSALNLPHTYLDTVYHSACAKMFQTYEVFTTGLDGTIPMNYNVFTHWLGGHLAYFFEIPIHQYYNLTYPIVFFAFWIFAFLELVQRLFAFFAQKRTSTLTNLSTSLWFWVIFLCILFPLPDNIYTRGLLGLHFVQTHTYTIALGFFFIFVESLITFWQTESQKKVLIWFFLPVFGFVLGTAHVAVVVALTAGAGYLFLRKKLFTKWYYWLWILLMLANLVICYLFTAETIPFSGQEKSYEGRMEWFHFFRQEHFEPFNFWIVFYGTLYVATFLYLWNEKISLSNWFRRTDTIFIELLWVVALAGIAPNVVLVLFGSTGMYFLSVQRFLAAAFLLAYFPFIPALSFNFWKWLKYPVFVGIALLMYMMYRNNFNDSWEANFQARKKIMQINDFSWKATHYLENVFRPQHPDWHKAKRIFSDSLQIRIQQNSYYQFIQKIAELNKLPVAEKEEALLYIPFHKLHFPQWETALATQDGMYLVGVSGLALLNGLPPPKYPVGAYGFGYYDHSLREKTWTQGFTTEELKKLTLQKGFKYLYLFQPEKQNFEKITCSEPAR